VLQQVKSFFLSLSVYCKAAVSPGRTTGRSNHQKKKKSEAREDGCASGSHLELNKRDALEIKKWK